MARLTKQPNRNDDSRHKFKNIYMMAQIVTVITKFRETLLFCLHGFISLIYTLKPL